MHHKDMPIITAKHCLSCFLYFRSAVPPLLVVRDSPSLQVELYFNGVIPYVQFMMFVYLALVSSKGLQTVGRGTGAPSLLDQWEGSVFVALV